MLNYKKIPLYFFIIIVKQRQKMNAINMGDKIVFKEQKILFFLLFYGFSLIGFVI